MSEAKLSLAVFRSLACRPCDNCTKPYFTLSTRLIKPPYAHLEGVWSRCVCNMGPGDDAPIVGGESAQSHPTRDDLYTHLNAMNPKDEAMSTENVCHSIVIDQVFTLLFIHVYRESRYSLPCGAFLPKCVYDDHLKKCRYMEERRRLETSKGKTPTIY